MEHSSGKKSSYGIWIDLPFIRRNLKRWMPIFLCLSIICGVIAYIGADQLGSDTYTVSATVAVLPKTNSVSAISSNNTDAAVTRNVAMWNSSNLKRLIKESNQGKDISGSLYASAIQSTGLVRLTATASTAEDAYCLLNYAIKDYHQIDSNFDKNYSGIVLTRMTTDSISVAYHQPWKIGFAGFIFVLFGGAGLVVLISMLVDVIHNEEQAKQLLEVPVYNSLVSINKKKLNIKAILITQPNIDTDYLESMTRITSRVEQHMFANERKIIMVSSIQENEGKSTVAVNLALNLAKRGRRTLLVDLDFRRPVLYKIFDREKGEKGLSSTLEAGESLRSKATEETALFGLHVLWQYRPVKDSDRFIERMNLAAQFAELKEDYDYIILDTPPIGPVRDAEVIAGIADASLLVVREDFCRGPVVNDVTDQLEEHGAPCMGVILNNCQGKRKVGRKTKNKEKAKGSPYSRKNRTGSHNSGENRTGSHNSGENRTGSHNSGENRTGSHNSEENQTGSRPGGEDKTGSRRSSASHTDGRQKSRKEVG